MATLKLNARSIEEKQASKGALQKAEGFQVKNNVELLAKSIKKQDEIKSNCKRSWLNASKNRTRERNNNRKREKQTLRKRKLKIKNINRMNTSHLTGKKLELSDKTTKIKLKRKLEGMNKKLKRKSKKKRS
ncbi:uncharacterized protein LOC130689161 [Daphnia carinata]|uniref:uncharacterized protein LOC130689161 n=1 Tax=Daphnia carinata TaxID=120202 RepID=UPI00257BB458|nr:uncharacterized protein LOC130689161 [Daphnia carinata]XP_057368172.1 uncharacterized protein LOC130689161 [Daphnia carinata]XP_057368173.1 uncharacterized protein LOC130689161 [Daphnia carinata]